MVVVAVGTGVVSGVKSGVAAGVAVDVGERISLTASWPPPEQATRNRANRLTAIGLIFA